MQTRSCAYECRWYRLYMKPFLKSVRTPLLIGLCNRLALFLLAYFGLALNPGVSHPWRAFPENYFLDSWFRWDTGWYFRIIQEGYTVIPGPQQPTNFFPLYPLLSGGLAQLVGNPYIAGFIVSNVSLLIASVFLYRIVTEIHSERVARRALILMLCYPFSFYFSAMYTESLFLVSSLGAFYFARQNRFAVAVLFAAAAGATRLVGVLVVIPVVLYYLQSCEWNFKKLRRDAFFLPLGFAGVFAYMFFLWIRFQNPVAFLSLQWVAGWGNEHTLGYFFTVMGQVFNWQRFVTGQYDIVSFINVASAAILLAITLKMAKKIGWIPTVWAVITLLVSLRIWRASGRYAGVIFPAFVGAALFFETRPLAYQWVLTFSCLLLGLLTYCFSHGMWIC